MSDLHYFVVKVSEDQVSRFNREVGCSFELICCSDCKYDHECTHMVVRKSKGGGNVCCPVFYCSEGKRKEE